MKSINGIQHPNIPYVIAQDVRDEGIASSSLSDVRLAKLILRYSRTIDLYTSTWFGAIRDKAIIDGNGSSKLYLDNQIPINKIYSIEVLDDKEKGSHYGFSASTEGVGVFGTLDSSSYEISHDNRAIELLGSSEDYFSTLSSSRRFFPEGIGNIIVDGIFGYTDKKKELSFTLSQSLNNGDMQVVLNDVSGIEAGDVLVFSPAAGSIFYNIVGNVDSATNTVIINYSLNSASIGDSVFIYGSVPELIRYACMRLVIKNSGSLGQTLFGVSGSIDPSLVIFERTDNFQYRISEKLLSDVMTNSLTGDFEVDRILLQYMSSSIDGEVI